MLYREKRTGAIYKAAKAPVQTEWAGAIAWQVYGFRWIKKTGKFSGNGYTVIVDPEPVPSC